jgi:hypothetical protein
MGHTDNYYIQQAPEQEIAEAKATHATKQVEQRLKRVEKRDSKPEGRKKEMSCGDMFNVLLFFSRLSGPQDSLELNLPPSQPNPEDVSRRKVERWLQHN